MSLNQFSQEQIKEMSLIELAYELLVEKNEPFFFNDLVEEMAALKGTSKSEIAEKIAQFYTDLNIDGRFTSLGENRWGLKTWYPVDQVEEEVVHTVKAKKKKKTKKAAIVDEDIDLDLEDDLEELDDEDLEDLDDDFDDSDDDEDLLEDDDLEELDEDDLLEDDDDLEDLDEDLDEDLLDDEELELEDEELDEEEEEDK